jgi:hypothetical protein
MRCLMVAIAGLLLASGVAQATHQSTLLQQLRSQYPETMAEFEAECQSPDRLELKRFTIQATPPSQRVLLNCWNLPQASGDRRGWVLGQLPLAKTDPTFVKPMKCAVSDSQCATALQRVKAQYPALLKQAEFKCSTKDGTLLFTDITSNSVELRCGFFDTQLYDTKGNGQNVSESFTSVDIAIRTFKLAP